MAVKHLHSVGVDPQPSGYGSEGWGLDSDWVIFQRLNREADTVSGEAARNLRTDALRLVRGCPFDGVLADSYEWVDEEHLRTTMTIAVAKCAQRLGDDLFEAGDLLGAESAASSGLRGAPDDFGLWDLGARAIDARGDRTALNRWLADASRHLDPAEMERIRAGLTHHDPSET